MKIKKYQALIAHIVVQLPSLFAAATFFAQTVREHWRAKYTITIPAWAYQPAVPKLDSILEYLLLVTVGALLMLWVFLWARKPSDIVVTSKKALLGFVCYEVFTQFALSYSGSVYAGIVLLALFPLWLATRHLPSMRSTARNVWLCAGFGFTACIVAVLVATSWSPQLRFINDYSDFATYTRMSDRSVVETHAFAEQHDIDLHSIDLRVPGYAPPKVVLSLPRDVFKGPDEAFFLFPPTRGIAYDWDRQKLTIMRATTIRDKLRIQALWGIDAYNWVPLVTKAKPESDTSLGVPSKEQKLVAEFLSKNVIELDSQREAGRFFYHHGYLYLPAVEQTLEGKPIMPAQYGKGLTWVLAKYLSAVSIPSFQNYYYFLWVGLYLYLALLLAAVWLITKDAWVALLSAGLGIATVLVVSPDALRLAPGFNPIRHFPDVVCFMALAWNMRARSWASALVRALVMTAFIWWNREFGLFFLGAGWAWMVFGAILSGVGKRRAFLQILLEGLLAAAVLLLGHAGASGNDLAALNLAGVGAGPTTWAYIFGWLAVWAVALATVVFSRLSDHGSEDAENGKVWLDLAGTGILYGAFSTVYVIWNASPNHVAVLCLTVVLPVAVYGKWLAVRVSKVSSATRGLRQCAALVTLALLLGMTRGNYAEYRKYEQVFESHQLFRWNFRGLAGITTGAPGQLQDDLDLISKYAPTGRLLFISRYDSLFLTAATRATVFPYVDLTGAAVSEDLVNKIVGRIMASNAPYIFVDRDLLRDRESEVSRGEGYKPDAVDALRVGTASALALIARSVQHCYAPGESKGGLQVWRRTCPVDQQ